MKGDVEMDTGLGNLTPISDKMAQLCRKKSLKGKIFELDEVVQVKDSRFRITNIGETTLTLTILADDERT